jgi:23S rRNA pseudouridine2604 synthase
LYITYTTAHMNKPRTNRLERHLAEQGLASRREAKAIIKQGLVKVNGKVTYIAGMAIDPTVDKIVVNTKKIPAKEAVLFYKPRGIETSATTENSKDIHGMFPELSHLAPTGRLDKESEGLIILSNDGVLARSLTQKSHIEKEYHVNVRENIVPAQMERMENGMRIGTMHTKPATVEKLGTHTFSIILTEGQKHQIRRMCDACRLTITSLVRVRIGNIYKGTLKPGSMRKLATREINLLKKIAS